MRVSRLVGERKYAMFIHSMKKESGAVSPAVISE
jgi:hypothetical protein